jgi:hypothetical protein
MADIEKTTFTFPDPDSAEEKKTGNETSSEYEVEVIDDTPDDDKGRTPLREPPADVTDDELAKYTDTRLKSRLAHLGKGIHDERRSKEAANRERDEAVRVAQSVVAENQRLQGTLSTNQSALLEQAKRNVNSEIEEAKREYKAAYEQGDSDAVLSAQEKLTTAKIKADRISNYRPPPIQPLQNVVQNAQIQQAPQLDDKTRNWQEHNSWFGRNQKMTAYALSLHKELVDSGVPVASDSYYSKIDADVRSRFPETFDGESSADAKQSQRPRSNVVASASRSTAPKKIVLTQTQVSLAKRLNVPLEVYAREVAKQMRTEK